MKEIVQPGLIPGNDTENAVTAHEDTQKGNFLEVSEPAWDNSEEIKLPALESANNPIMSMVASGQIKDMEMIKELIALYNAEEERTCKKNFDARFAAMQKEFTPIARTKKGAFGKYAPLEKMTEKYGPIITGYGFSFRWETEKERIMIDNVPHKRTYIIVSGHGYERRETFFDAPQHKPNAGQSAIQAAGIEATYSQRYTFKAAFGIAEIDEDTDGTFSFEDGIEYADQVKKCMSAKNKEELSALYQGYVTEARGKGDKRMVKIIAETCRKREAQLYG